jgi:tripartite-type tricarboxylate transporter receptor subunit TctC
VSSTRRSAILPDTPTLTELGVNVDINGWYCIMGPVGMPKAIVSRLNTEINRILSLPDVKEQLASLGATIMGGAPGQVTALIKSDMAKYAQAIRASGAKPD